MTHPEPHETIWAELIRLKLAEQELPSAGFAFEVPVAVDEFLTHLRALAPGATWYDVFPDLNDHRALVANDEMYQDRGHPLGGFDFPESPRGSAVFATADHAADVAALTAAMERARQLPIPVYGAGLVLDHGHPHLFIVLPLGAPDEHVHLLADFLRAQPGIGNAYPERIESSHPPVQSGR